MLHHNAQNVGSIRNFPDVCKTIFYYRTELSEISTLAKLWTWHSLPFEPCLADRNEIWGAPLPNTSSIGLKHQLDLKPTNIVECW